MNPSPLSLTWTGRRIATLPSALALLLVATAASAAEWQVIPSIGLQLTLTDNVNLTPAEFAQGDLVTQLTPAVSFTGKSAHASLSGAVSVPILYYAHTASENNKAYPIANIVGNVEAVEKFLYVDAAISYTQPYLTPFGAQPGTLTNATPNRYTAANYLLSPYIKGETPGQVSYELRNNNSWSNLSGAPISTSNSYTSEWIGKVGSLPAPLGWLASFDAVDVKFNNQPPQRTNIARVGAIFQYDPQLRFTGDVGYEDNRYPFTDYAGAVYGVGLQWRPAERTRVVAKWEHRFFGSSYLFSVDHRTPLSVWTLGAYRNITTYAQQLGTLGVGVSVQQLLDQLLNSRIPDPTQRQDAVNALIQNQGLPSVLSSPVNVYSQQILLTEGVNATVGLLGVRNSVFVTLFYLRTEPISGSGLIIPVLLNSDRNTQRGANVTWSHKLTPFLSLNLSANALRTTATPPAIGTTNQAYATLGMTAAITPRTSLIAGARFQTLRSDIITDYKEKALFAGLTYTFK